MNIHLERKFAVNQWIIKARRFYAFGILIIGFLTKTLSDANVSFSFVSMVLFVVVVLAVNAVFNIYLEVVSKKESERQINILGVCQIVLELIVFILVTHKAGGVDSIALVFYFLPIVSSSLLFGLSGAVLTSLAAGILLNGLVALEYAGVIGHINRYGVETIEFKSLPYTLTKTLTISFFYLIVGVFSGLGARLLNTREEQIMKKTEEADKANKELKQKVGELEKSQKLSFNAFADLKQERIISDSERKRTAAILSNFIDPIILISKNHIINFVNPAAREVLGLDTGTLSKQIDAKNHYSMDNFKELLSFNYTVNPIKNEDKEGESKEELIIHHSDHDVTYKITTVDVHDDQKNRLGTMKIFYDFTREKMIDKIKSEFISIAAHQLRTPLSAIKWAIKMVLDGDVGKLNKEQEKILFKGYASNERIIKLVNDMLDVSRIEEGRFNYEFKKENFLEVLGVAVEHVNALIKSKKIKLRIKHPKKLPLVNMDKEKMLMAIENLLENAAEYTLPGGEIDITIESGTKLVRFKIQDSGVGVPKQDQEKLFSKFFRASNVIRMQTDGSGLGLFIVKNVIKKHNGKINFSSEESKGTEFVFTIPTNK